MPRTNGTGNTGGRKEHQGGGGSSGGSSLSDGPCGWKKVLSTQLATGGKCILVKVILSCLDNSYMFLGLVAIGFAGMMICHDMHGRQWSCVLTNTLHLSHIGFASWLLNWDQCTTGEVT